MPYETLIEGAQILKPVGQVLTADGESLGFEHVSVIYPQQGTIIPDEDVSPVVQKLYDEDDEWTKSILKKVSNKSEDSDEKPAVKKPARKPKAAPKAAVVEESNEDKEE